MPYTVTFYAMRPGLGEVPVTVHRFERSTLCAYTSTPGIALAAQSVGREPQADGFRVVCPAGKVVLDYVGRVGRG